jgi:anthranilate/para-aminobenzoate synthase component I
MGYYRFRDGGKFSILIRSLVHSKKDNILSFHVGSGITCASNPEKELEETYLKAEKLLGIFSPGQQV